MIYIDITKYSEETQDLVQKLTKFQGRWKDGKCLERPYMTDEDKKEFTDNLKKIIDLDEIPFAERMVFVHELCMHSREVGEFLFGKE